MAQPQVEEQLYDIRPGYWHWCHHDVEIPAEELPFFPRYRMVSQSGRGRFARVYYVLPQEEIALAQQNGPTTATFDRLIQSMRAIKMQCSDGPDAPVSPVQNEIRAIRDLRRRWSTGNDRRWFTDILDLPDENDIDQSWFVMRALRGQNLRSYLEQLSDILVPASGPARSLRDKVQGQILSLVSRLHSLPDDDEQGNHFRNPIMHGDLSVNNIWVNTNIWNDEFDMPQLTLLDFGHASRYTDWDPPANDPVRLDHNNAPITDAESWVCNEKLTNDQWHPDRWNVGHMFRTFREGLELWGPMDDDSFGEPYNPAWQARSVALDIFPGDSDIWDVVADSIVAYIPEEAPPPQGTPPPEGTPPPPAALTQAPGSPIGIFEDEDADKPDANVGNGYGCDANGDENDDPDHDLDGDDDDGPHPASGAPSRGTKRSRTVVDEEEETEVEDNDDQQQPRKRTRTAAVQPTRVLSSPSPYGPASPTMGYTTRPTAGTVAPSPARLPGYRSPSMDPPQSHSEQLRIIRAASAAAAPTAPVAPTASAAPAPAAPTNTGAAAPQRRRRRRRQPDERTYQGRKIPGDTYRAPRTRNTKTGRQA